MPAYLNGQLKKVEQVVGEPGKQPPSFLRLRGPFLAQRNRTPNALFDVVFFFPLPADAHLEGDVYRSCVPKSHAEQDVLTDLERYALLWPQQEGDSKDDESNGGVWVDLNAMRDYLLKGELPRSCVKMGSVLFQRERRFGIMRDDATRATEEKMLYEAEFICPCKNVGLYVAIEGLDWPAESGMLGIGGEGRTGYYHKVSPPSIEHCVSPEAGRFKVVFLTPTYFRQGWRSENWESLLGLGTGLVAAAFQRPLVVGGFYLAKKRHNPSPRFVSAGIVYYLEGKPPLEQSILVERPKDKNDEIDFGQIGFGQIIIGGW